MAGWDYDSKEGPSASEKTSREESVDDVTREANKDKLEQSDDECPKHVLSRAIINTFLTNTREDSVREYDIDSEDEPNKCLHVSVQPARGA